MLPKALQKTRILICRPSESAQSLADTLSAVGATCHVLPTIEIKPTPLTEIQKQAILALDQYEIVIVCSQHAAQFGLDHIENYWPQFPSEQTWIPIGRQTAKRLEQEPIKTLNVHADLTSEGLLEIPKLQKIKGQKILILKGEGGRDALEQILTKRGAKVDSLSLYFRQRPSYSTSEIQKATLDFDPEYLICLSGETLSNLISLCELENINLSSKTLIVPSHRVANIAYERGFKSVLIPDNLNPIDLIKCISNYKKTH